MFVPGHVLKVPPQNDISASVSRIRGNSHCKAHHHERRLLSVKTSAWCFCHTTSYESVSMCDYLAMYSGFPPRMISVPLPAMLVAMVTALLRPL